MEKKIHEALRYLGYRGKEPDPLTLQLVCRCMAELEGRITCRWVRERFPLSIQGNKVTVGPLVMTSRNLAKHLQGCSEVVLFAATLGVGADQLLQKYEKLDVARAAVVQACGASLIEEYCDRCQEELAQQLRPEGLWQRSRFSPGYGDLSLEHQPLLLELLQAPKRIGLTCTDSQMLLPTKSVTAIIGLTHKETPNHCQKGCSQCPMASCPFRKEETL